MIEVKASLNWNGDDVKVRGKKVMNKSLFAMGLIIEGQAKELAPIDTGRLAGSITTQSKTESTKPDGNAKSGDVIKKPTSDEEVYVGTAVDYAPYMEFGTVRSEAQAYLRPALALAQGKTLRTFEENGKRYFADYLRK